MSISMYDVSIPVLLRGCDNLFDILKKGEAHLGADLLEARLAPDMYTIVGQVQRASDTAKGCAARLAGVANPSFADEEKTFADLYARIDKTADFLSGVTREQIDGSEDRTIEIKSGGQTLTSTGLRYLQTFVLPNFFFHITTAYGILRHNGVPLGKMDYLGEM